MGVYFRQHPNFWYITPRGPAPSVKVHGSLDSNLDFIFLSLPKAKIITVHSRQCTAYLFPFYHFKAADSYVLDLIWVLFRSGAEILAWEFFFAFLQLDCSCSHLLLLWVYSPISLKKILYPLQCIKSQIRFLTSLKIILLLHWLIV